MSPVAEQQLPPDDVPVPRGPLSEWTRQDPAPDRSVRAVVDEFGVTWSRDDLLVEGIRGWQQRLLTHTPGVGWNNPAVVRAGVVAPSWLDIFRVVEGPLRLATAREALRWMERWLPDGEVRPRVG